MSITAEVQDERALPGPCSPSAVGPADPGSRVTYIARRNGWRAIDLPELWRSRELLLFLAWRDVKVRYKQTALGATWAVLQPLSIMVVFSLVLGRVASGRSAAIPYPLYLLAGLLPWLYFSNGVAAASQSVVTNQSLVTKTYFPRLIIPLAPAVAGLVDLGISFGLLAIAMARYGVAPGWGLLLLPLLLTGLVMTAVGVGVLLSALTVTYRDFRYVVPFMIQLWMFLTPSIYLQAEGSVSTTARPLLNLNPLNGLIVNFRAALLGGAIRWGDLSIALAVGAALLVIGCSYFRRVERSFADII